MTPATVMPAIGRVDVYPVGLLRDLIGLRNVVRARRWPLLRGQLRWIARGATWPPSSYWNGYLAEPYVFPAGVKSCGHGWTPTRARRSLLRQLDAGRMDTTNPGEGALWLEWSVK